MKASIRANRTNHFLWIGSDSWGAKVYPVRNQEYAAVNTITVLPHRTNLEGMFNKITSDIHYIFSLQMYTLLLFAKNNST